jgi:hypothetical protein
MNLIKMTPLDKKNLDGGEVGLIEMDLFKCFRAEFQPGPPERPA